MISGKLDSDLKKSTESDLHKPRLIMKIMSRDNVCLFLLSREKIGARFPGPGAPVALLEYTGYKSGRLRTMSVAFGLHGERVFLFASQGGMRSHPI